MKNYIRCVILLSILSMATCGCDPMGISKKDDDEILTVVPVDDPQLAKLILKPQQKAVNVSRDPFRPIHDWSAKHNEVKGLEPVKQQFSNLIFIGMIKMDDQAIALLKASQKKLMLKVNDQYKDFVLTEITNSQVTFSDGVNQITLKRGVKK